jgi:ferredoxin
MKIVIGDLCTGFGICESIRPDIFEVNEQGLAEAMDEGLTEEDRADVEYAVAQCPTQAIRIVEN